MKFITAIILSFLLLTQVFSKWLMILEYNINKDFIASKLCVNKERPKLLCKGKCQLIKKMAAEEEDNNASSGFQLGKTIFSDASFEKEDYSFLPVADQASNFTTLFIIGKYSSPVTAIFHPPALV